MANYEPRIEHNILFHILDDSNTYEICGGEKDKKQKVVEKRTMDERTTEFDRRQQKGEQPVNTRLMA
jgi:hypothetical protein